MYQALYRKWRPKTFDEVIGQSHVTETLKKEISLGRISHAYMFTGCRGTGKTTCAKIFAKAVNCLHPINGEPCRKCELCTETESDSLMDIVEIDAASNNSVENIRSMREEVVFSPTKGKYRVYIVDEVHMLSSGAFNAFLKILEEPPAHVIFILATTEIHKIPLTILSRCQRFDFFRVSPDDIQNRMRYICNQEKIEAQDAALSIIANAADGAVRDALSILDQCANVCQNNITEEDVKNILGISGSSYLYPFVDAIVSNKTEKCIEIIDDVYKQSKNMVRFCEELMFCFRDIMIEKLNETSHKNSNLFDASKIDISKIIFYIDTLRKAYKNITSGSKPKLEMEVTAVKLCNSVSETAVTTINTSNSLKEVSEKFLPKSNSKISTTFPEVAAPTALSLDNHENAFKQWPEILNLLESEKGLKSLYISLKDSKAYENKNYLLIDSKNSVAFELLRNSSHRTVLKEIIKKVTGRHYNLGPYVSQKVQDPLDELIEKAKENNIKTN